MFTVLKAVAEVTAIHKLWTEGELRIIVCIRIPIYIGWVYDNANQMIIRSLP